MFKELEKKRIDLIIRSIDYRHIEQRVVASFADDVHFSTSWREHESKIQEVVSYCIKIREVTRGKLQDKNFAKME